MDYRSITCASCGETIGRYPVFSHAHDEADTGDAEYRDNYGGETEGEYYCLDCYPEADPDDWEPEDAE